MRGIATAALYGGWARPLLPFLAVGPAFWISSLGGAWLPAACPRLSTRSLSGCCSFLPLPEDLVCGLGLVARREGTALRRGGIVEGWGACVPPLGPTLDFCPGMLSFFVLVDPVALEADQSAFEHYNTGFGAWRRCPSACSSAASVSL